MQSVYRFPTFEVLVAQCQLRTRGGVSIPIGSRAFNLLLALIERRNQIVTKKELIAAVWKGLVVEESNVQVQVSLLRNLLGADVVATVPGQGYRLSISPENDEISSSLDSPDYRRIAVLAFRSADDSSSGQMLARGLAHDLISELSRNSDLRVICHHSSFIFSEGYTPLQEIGLRLRCRYIVDGVINFKSENLSINVELLDAVEGSLIWTFQKTMQACELHDARDALVSKIGGSIHTRSQHMESRRMISSLSPPLDSYGRIWKASALLTQFSNAATREARFLLEDAVKAHPGHSSGWAWLGYLNALDAIMRITGEWHPGRFREYMDQITTALALDPENATACRALSIGYRAVRNFDEALAAAQRGVDVAPSNPHCLQVLAEAQCAVGDTVSAMLSIENALDLHPYPPAWVYAIYAYALWSAGRLTDALAAANNGLAELPHYWPARLVKIYTLHEIGAKHDAIREGLVIRQQLPRLTATAVLKYWADSATELRARAVDAALLTGIPQGRYDPSQNE